MNKKFWLVVIASTAALTAGVLWLVFASSPKLISRLKPSIAQFNFQTEADSQLLILKEVDSKEDFVKAKLIINGGESFANLDLTNAKLRGRGSSTFEQPKMPYKLKLGKKQPILNLPAGEDWVLLANYQDGSLLSAMLSSKLAQLLNLPFSPQLQPVELRLNNEYLGLYWLTPQREVSKQRINLTNKGWLVELTANEEASNEPTNKSFYLFNHPASQLPVLVHYPRLHKQAEKKPEQAAKKLLQIQQEMNASFPQQLDKTNLARLIVFYELTANTAINSPQSIFVHKTAAKSNLAFGPVWDFDEAFGGSANQVFFSQGATGSVFNPQSLGGAFFLNLLQDAETQQLINQEWQNFKEKGLAELLAFKQEYVELLASSGAFKRDYQRWHKEQNANKADIRLSLEDYAAAANLWLTTRINFLNSHFYY